MSGSSNELCQWRIVAQRPDAANFVVDGNFDGVFEQAYQDSYLPFLDVFERTTQCACCRTFSDTAFQHRSQKPRGIQLQTHRSFSRQEIKNNMSDSQEKK